jgi:hypothetical protein
VHGTLRCHSEGGHRADSGIGRTRPKLDRHRAVRMRVGSFARRISSYVEARDLACLSESCRVVFGGLCQCAEVIVSGEGGARSR